MAARALTNIRIVANHGHYPCEAGLCRPPPGLQLETHSRGKAEYSHAIHRNVIQRWLDLSESVDLGRSSTPGVFAIQLRLARLEPPWLISSRTPPHSSFLTLQAAEAGLPLYLDYFRHHRAPCIQHLVPTFGCHGRQAAPQLL